MNCEYGYTNNVNKQKRNIFNLDIEVSATQLSYDKQEIYNFAKNYNGWFKTNINNGETELMKGLRYEPEYPDLIFDILFYLYN